jgi:Tol biopolymer transport system component
MIPARNCVVLLLWLHLVTSGAQPAPELERLAAEVRHLGWIVFPAHSEHGDWDLYVMRPDGSQRRPLTRTSDWNEAAPQFSRDGRQLLYRRLKRTEKIEGNRYGEQGTLVIVNSDGTGERTPGGEGELPWASWSPDGRELATLSLRGIAFVDPTTGQTRRTFPRRGFFQQLTWSPNGKWLVGVANSFGTGWSIARMDAFTGETGPINKVDCCTPDWFPDSSAVIFSWRPPGQKANRGIGWTQLWQAEAEGKRPRLVYGEDGRHIYGGHISPDGRYALFTGNPQEDGDPQHAGAPMGLIRLSDTPIIGGASAELRQLHPTAKNGPVLVLPSGWEPCWTSNENVFATLLPTITPATP